MEKEPLVLFIGFLGAGKTTLLKDLVSQCISAQWNPYIILNDYQNAGLDAQWFRDQFEELKINPMSGSCVCCSGIRDLQFALKNPPENRAKPITLIEANGTTDPIEILSFMSVGLENYSPPIQITPVNVKLFATRGEYNELEEIQLSTASIILPTWTDEVSPDHLQNTLEKIKSINPRAELWKKSDFQRFPNWIQNIQKHHNFKLDPSHDHSKLKSHWSSLEIDLPKSMSKSSLEHFLQKLEISNLRLKGCVRIKESHDLLHYFEKFGDNSIKIRPFPGQAAFEGKCILIAPNLDQTEIESVLKWALES